MMLSHYFKQMILKFVFHRVLHNNWQDVFFFGLGNLELR